MNYYQHHIGDFNNATRHLSLIERAIYRDLLDMYYDTEQAIDASNLDRLARRVQCSTEEQVNALKYVLDEFFNLDNGMYVNNRCEREIAEYHGKKKQASDAGKASAAKRAAKKKNPSNGGSSNDNEQPNENSTTVEAPLNEEQSYVQPTINHKPLTNNQFIDSSSNVREAENSGIPPIQFATYKQEDHKRYTLLECANQYPIHEDFIALASNRYTDVNSQDLQTMFVSFGDWFTATDTTNPNTPSVWLVKWYSWIQNNKDQVKRNREKQTQLTKQQNQSEQPGYFMNMVSEQQRSNVIDVTPEVPALGGFRS